MASATSSTADSSRLTEAQSSSETPLDLSMYKRSTQPAACGSFLNSRSTSSYPWSATTGSASSMSLWLSTGLGIVRYQDPKIKKMGARPTFGDSPKMYVASYHV